MRSHSTTLPVLALLVVAAIAGCIGSSEPVETDLPIEPGVSFDSFDAARSADGPTYKPDGLDWTKDDAESGTADDADYSNSHPIPVGSDTAKTLNVTVSLSSPTPLDELTFTLLDDGGAEQDSATLTADMPEATFTVEEVSTGGNWSVDVSGRGAGTSYSIDYLIHYEGESPYRLKVLEPLEPIPPGDAAFTFLLFDIDAGEPIADADLSLQSWMTGMGHGTNNEEADPVHDAHGVYVGKISPEMAGDWVVRIDYAPSDGEEMRFRPPVDVVEGE